MRPGRIGRRPDMKRRTLVALAATAGLTAVLVAAVAAAANGSRRSPDDAATGIHSTQSPRDVATYWTDERRNRATGG
jgi:phosphodiesterase/alkaline phosphatase D-like protein